MIRIWKWKVTAYYSDKVEPPKMAGDLAIETVHASMDSKDLEVEILWQREDIGRIDVEPLGPVFAVEQWTRENRKRHITEKLKLKVREVRGARN